MNMDQFQKEQENFEHGEENNNMDELMKRYKQMYFSDAYGAHRLVSGHANEYVVDWSCEEVADHSDTINKFKRIWEENRTLEDLISDQESGF